MVPEIKYAKSGGVHVAYQVVGEGKPDLVVVWGLMSHLELFWQIPTYVHFFKRLASFSRLIMFDKRGSGLSDRVGATPLLEERMDDIRAVMDAVGSERATIFGESEGVPLSLLFAATHPQRTTALVLYGSLVRAIRDATFPHAYEKDEFDQIVEEFASAWGTGASVTAFAPSLSSDPQAVQEAARFERLAFSPGALIDLARMIQRIDIRPILPSIQAPTLILHRAEDQVVPVEQARYLATHIPGARYVELRGSDHTPTEGDADAVLDQVQEFLTGVKAPLRVERAVATILITDLVASTERAARMGDRRWKELLERHEAVTRTQVGRYGGTIVDFAGDGVLATFDGPARAVRCACALRDEIQSWGLQMRAGLHTGEVELGGSKPGGIAIHIAQRVSANAEAGEVLVSRTVVDLVAGSGLEFVDRGEHSLKGLSTKWQLFSASE